MEIKRERATRTLTLNQTQAILKLLDECDMTTTRPLASPMDNQWKYGTEDALTDPKMLTQFRSRVGSLNHIARCTRPDISLAVNKLARHFNDPNPACFRALTHLLRYMAGSSTLRIRYHQGSKTTLSMEAYADSTFGGEHADKAKSQTGYLIFFGGGPIDWSSHLQSVIALSSAEAEQVSAFSTSRSIVHFRQFLEELGQKQLGPTSIREDNTACIAQSKNPVDPNRVRHVLIQYHYLRDLHEQGIVRLDYIATTDQVADVLTKPLLPQLFKSLIPFLVSPT